MRHATTYTSNASGRTTERVVGVTNGSAVVSLTIATPGLGAPLASAPLDVETAVNLAADLLMHALNLDAGTHGNQTHALDAGRGDVASAVILSDVRQLFANHAATLAEYRG
jgi:hypothetical protein